MSGLPEDIYYYSLGNSFSSDRAETFFCMFWTPRTKKLQLEFCLSVICAGLEKTRFFYRKTQPNCFFLMKPGFYCFFFLRKARVFWVFQKEKYQKNLYGVSKIIFM